MAIPYDGPDPNRAEVDNPPCRECKGYSYHSIECTLNVEPAATPTTLADALATALHDWMEWVVEDGCEHDAPPAQCAFTADELIKSASMQAWLRANDAALVALAGALEANGGKWSGYCWWDNVGGPALEDHAAAIAAARERLNG